VLGAFLFIALSGAGFVPRTGYPAWLLAAAGLLVGFGTRLGSGCTSGHGVCGMSRLSRRSIAAVITFIGSGMATVALVNFVGGAW